MGTSRPIRDLEQIERMEHHLRNYKYVYYLAFKVGINTALRVGDMLRLKVYVVRNSYLRLKESKTRKYRNFLINDALRGLLDDYTKFMDDDDFLFRLPNRNVPVAINTYYYRLRAAADLVGLESIGTHTCRKTFAYHFYRRYAAEDGLAQLMVILNHASERETLQYIGVLQEEVDNRVKGFYI